MNLVTVNLVSGDPYNMEATQLKNKRVRMGRSSGRMVTMGRICASI